MLKAALRAKQLECHPDKCVGLTVEERLKRREHFEMLIRAWKVLGDSGNRQRYDAALRQALLQQDASAPIHCTLAWSDFTMDDSEHEMNKGNATLVPVHPDTVYVAPCRCGGDFILEGVAALARIPFAHCFQCSLVARVTYPPLSATNKDLLDYFVFYISLCLLVNWHFYVSLLNVI